MPRFGSALGIDSRCSVGSIPTFAANAGNSCATNPKSRSTDASGMAPDRDPCTPDDIAATIFHQLGIPHTTELQTPTGRPMQLFREGKVIGQLLA